MFNHFLMLCKNIKSYDVNKMLNKAVLKKIDWRFQKHERCEENPNPVTGN